MVALKLQKSLDQRFRMSLAWHHMVVLRIKGDRSVNNDCVCVCPPVNLISAHFQNKTVQLDPRPFGFPFDNLHSTMQIRKTKRNSEINYNVQQAPLRGISECLKLMIETPKFVVYKSFDFKSPNKRVT